MLFDVEEELRAENAALRASLHRERRTRDYRADVQRLLVQTADKIDPSGVAEVIARGFTEIVQAGWVAVAFLSAEEPDVVEIIFGPTVPTEVADDWRRVPLSTDVPMISVLRGDVDSIEMSDSNGFGQWPLFAAEKVRADMASFYCMPIADSNGVPVASIGLAWPQPHAIVATERTLLDDIISASAPAFERARRAATDRQVAQTLQTWLLPPSIPEHERLDVATLYVPNRDEMSVGGDWYDVVQLDETTSAFVVGDVVGHNVRAAAEMGQVRHVLACNLLVTKGDPALSLQLTDDYFSRRTPDTMATAVVIVVGIDDGVLTMASAGHLPPIVTEPGTASRLVELTVGPPIGAGLGTYSNVERRWSIGSLLTAFTDGVVERRDQVIDDALLELCGDIDRAIERNISASTSAGVVASLLADRVSAEAADDDAAAMVLRRL